MKRSTFARSLSALLAVVPLGLRAQVEQLTEWQRQGVLARLPELTANAKSAALRTHLQGLGAPGTPAARQAAVNAARVALDVTNAAIQAPFVHYAVPPMGEYQRLPDLYPVDGEANVPVRIVAAQGEYEPGAFTVYPLADLGKVAFSLTPFRSAEGQTLPAEQLDLKLLKVWYQNKNAWYSYFGDTGFKLVAELLLNDEDLIRVDESAGANYARLTAPDGTVTSRWLNPPREMDVRFPWHYRGTHLFAPMRPDFADAATLRPVALGSGRFTTFFLTAHATTNTAPGLYTGSVRLTRQNAAIGEIPVAIRVLPFALPAPKCYFDTDKDFLTASYSYISLGMIMEENGGDWELAKRQLREVFRNQVTHNQLIHWMRGDRESETRLMIDLMREVGMRTDVLLGGLNVSGGSSRAGRESAARRAAQWFDQVAGHHNVFIGYGDEPGASWLVGARPIYEAYQRAGFKFIIAGGDSVFYKAGYLYDWHNIAKWPEVDTSTRIWNEVGNAHVAWYAAMHVGPENPAFNRRQYGLANYLANYSATCNYAHHFGPYNDDSTTYRPMVFAYGVHGGVLDTIQWEGYREGIDDIRYATALKRLAQAAAKSASIETRYAGNKALQYMATLSRTDGDLQAVRFEMIQRILALREMR
jgi:hypothetical protein